MNDATRTIFFRCAEAVKMSFNILGNKFIRFVDAPKRDRFADAGASAQ